MTIPSLTFPPGHHVLPEPVWVTSRSSSFLLGSKNMNSGWLELPFSSEWACVLWWTSIPSRACSHPMIVGSTHHPNTPTYLGQFSSMNLSPIETCRKFSPLTPKLCSQRFSFPVKEKNGKTIDWLWKRRGQIDTTQLPKCTTWED